MGVRLYPKAHVPGQNRRNHQIKKLLQSDLGRQFLQPDEQRHPPQPDQQYLDGDIANEWKMMNYVAPEDLAAWDCSRWVRQPAIKDVFN